MIRSPNKHTTYKPLNINHLTIRDRTNINMLTLCAFRERVRKVYVRSVCFYIKLELETRRLLPRWLWVVAVAKRVLELEQKFSDTRLRACGIAS